MEDESRVSGIHTKIVKVEIDEETEVIVEARILPGESESDVSDRLQKFDKVTAAIEKISGALARAWENVGPSRASVEFHVEFAWSAGELLAMFVQGDTRTSLKVTLEWEKAHR